MVYPITRFGKYTVGNFTIKVIGDKTYTKGKRFEYGLFDKYDNFISRSNSIEKLKELVSKMEAKENE